MAALIFVISLGVSVDIHYCGGELKHISLNGRAEVCDAMKEDHQTPKNVCCHSKPSKHLTNEVSNQPEIHDGCCHNETFIIELDKDFSNKWKTIVFDQDVDFQPRIPVVIPFRLDQSLRYNGGFYRPPPLAGIKRSIIQTYLI